MQQTNAPLHPRPDFNRGAQEGSDWLSLDGPWSFCFEETGCETAPAEARAEGYERTIRVPFPWQSHLAWGTEALAGNDNWYSKEALIHPGEAHSTPRSHGGQPQYEVGWYRRGFTVPEAWDGKRIILHIGAADWHVTAWCNGVQVGDADSGYLPLAFDLTDALAEGGNELVVRVFDPMDHARQPVGKQWEWYTRTSGIWQPVWLEPRGEAHVISVKATPDVEAGTVFLCAKAEGVGEGAQLRVALESPTGEQIAQTLTWEDGWFCGTVRLEEAVLWTPETPELYGLTATLLIDGQAADEVYSYFGMRSVGVAPLNEDGPNYVALNGEPIYLIGALDQSFNPWGVYAWPDDEAARRDVELTKESGFNFLRIHIKLEDPRFLYWCDRLGVLIQADMPCFGYAGWSEIAKQRHEAIIRGAVERDFNHPCIFSWCLFNETWGLGDGYDFNVFKQDPPRHDWVESMYQLAKDLDPTRLIEDNSPCHYDHVITDINSWHFYINDYEKAREHVALVVHETQVGSGFNYVPGRRQGDAPLMNSEYGGIGAGMGDMDVSWCFRFLTTLLRRQEKVCGYVYTELQDIEWEHNGFYDYDRSPKEFGYDPARLQREVFVGFDCQPGITVGVNEEFSLPVFISDMRAPEGKVEVALRAEGVDSLGRSFQGGTGLATVHGFGLRVFAVDRLAWPSRIDRPGLVTVNLQADGDAWNCVVIEARNGRLPAIETLEDGSTVLRKLAGEFEHSTAWHEAEIERGKVGEETHLVAGVGSGWFDYRFALPEGAKPEKLTLLFEASSKRKGVPQTSADKHPADLRVWLNGVVVDERMLADQPADSRGALSHMHGFHGRYGELVRVEIEGELLQRVLSSGEGLSLRLEVPGDSCNRGGLTVYGSRAGSVPCDLTVLVG